MEWETDDRVVRRVGIRETKEGVDVGNGYQGGFGVRDDRECV